MAPIPSLEELNKLRVVDLKERLSKLGLPQGGLKAQLISRLHAALLENSQDSGSSTEEEEQNDSPETQQAEILASYREEQAAAIAAAEAARAAEAREAEEREAAEREAAARELELQQKALEQQMLLEQQKMIEEENKRKQKEEEDLYNMQQEALREQQREEEEKRIQQQKLILQQQHEEQMMIEQQKLLEQQKILEQQKFLEETRQREEHLMQQKMLEERQKEEQLMILQQKAILEQQQQQQHQQQQHQHQLPPPPLMEICQPPPIQQHVIHAAGPPPQQVLVTIAPTISVVPSPMQTVIVTPLPPVITSTPPAPVMVTHPVTQQQQLQSPVITQGPPPPLVSVIHPPSPQMPPMISSPQQLAPMMSPILPPPMVSQGLPLISQPPPMVTQQAPMMVSQPPLQMMPQAPPTMASPMISQLPPLVMVSTHSQAGLPPPPMGMAHPSHPVSTGPGPISMVTLPSNVRIQQSGPPHPPHPMPPRMANMPPQGGPPPGMFPVRSGGDHPQQHAPHPPPLMSLDVSMPDDDMRDQVIRLPQALERVLALKSERAQQAEIEPEEMETQVGHHKTSKLQKEDDDDIAEAEEAEVEIPEKEKVKEPRPSKNQRRKQKKKKRRARNKEARQEKMEEDRKEFDENTEPDVEVQYIQDHLDLDPLDPMYFHFMSIFETFKLTDADGIQDSDLNKKLEEKKEPDLRKKPKDADEELEEEPKKEELQKLSKRKLKKLSRLSVAELKQCVTRPDVVEMHDVTAKDPKLLVHLKAYRNTVPVPRHWCFKRKYLQGKRGIEKPPFELPDFIKKTGIMEMRQALIEKEGHMTMKAKMRERVRPTLGKIDIDYQKLHDAFFKWQTKPRMTIHGDLYYEGKEFETRLKEKKPGDLSDELRTALGMPVGPNSHKVPPPWLIAMQRYGPPPSYPNLKIPGLNAPIPEGCSFGYHAGGWGKPPVDETGRPLYGDVFGISSFDYQSPQIEEEVDRTLWGELESESESESEEEEESEEEIEEEEPDKSGLATPAEGGLITPSGLTSIPTGMETPDMIELRKRKIEMEMEGGETPALYTILPEKKSEKIGGAMMGSTHIYDMTAAIPGGGRARPGFGSSAEGVEVTLDPSELDMDTAAMAARYEQTIREQQNQLAKEDLSDMVAEHAAKQKNKRKRQQAQETGKAAKKYKDFKF